VLRQLIAVIASAATLTACATKGYVRTEVQAAIDSSRATSIAGDESVRTDLTQQVASVRSGLDSVKTDVAALRQDLNGLRDEFGAKIVAMETGMSFAFPINFAFDDATIPTGSHAALDRFAEVMRKHYSGSLVTIEGFAADPGARHHQDADASAPQGGGSVLELMLNRPRRNPLRIRTARRET
jgi:outer membrane protein OmpA-like peptidoglycan-associated protein